MGSENVYGRSIESECCSCPLKQLMSCDQIHGEIIYVLLRDMRRGSVEDAVHRTLRDAGILPCPSVFDDGTVIGDYVGFLLDSERRLGIYDTLTRDVEDRH